MEEKRGEIPHHHEPETPDSGQTASQDSAQEQAVETKGGEIQANLKDFADFDFEQDELPAAVEEILSVGLPGDPAETENVAEEIQEPGEEPVSEAEGEEEEGKEGGEEGGQGEAGRRPGVLLQIKDLTLQRGSGGSGAGNAEEGRREEEQEGVQSLIEEKSIYFFASHRLHEVLEGGVVADEEVSRNLVEVFLVKHRKVHFFYGNLELQHLLLEKGFQLGRVRVDEERSQELLKERNFLLKNQNLVSLVGRGVRHALRSLLDHWLIIQSLLLDLVFELLHLSL